MDINKEIIAIGCMTCAASCAQRIEKTIRKIER